MYPIWDCLYVYISLWLLNGDKKFKNELRDKVNKKNFRR